MRLLKKTGELVNALKELIELTERLQPENISIYYSLLKQMRKEHKHVYLRIEFPTSYQQIIILENKLELDVKEELYEDAQKVESAIDELCKLGIAIKDQNSR